MHRMQSGGWPYSKVGRDSDLRKHCLFVQLFFVQLSFVRRSCVAIVHDCSKLRSMQEVEIALTPTNVRCEVCGGAQ